MDLSWLKKSIKQYKNLAFLLPAAIIVGVITGALDTVFGRVLIFVSNLRNENINWFIPFLPLAGVIIVFVYRKIGKNTSKGMGLVFEAGLDKTDKIPLRLIPLAMASTWVTHLFGGSAGREGVAVQLGATVSHFVGRKVKIPGAKEVMLVAGMAAGFAGLFHTPLAAVFFAMEILSVGVLQYRAIIPAVTASYIASETSKLLGLHDEPIVLSGGVELNVLNMAKLVLVSIIFGLAGGLFAFLLQNGKVYFAKAISNPYIKILVFGAAAAVILVFVHDGRYSGVGTNLIKMNFNGDTVYWYDWVLKLLLTVICLSSGFQGGEVTPLFTIGSTLGTVLGRALHMPTTLISALGYAAVFGSATNTLIAPMMIGAEIFGYKYMPYFFAVCSIAYVFNFNRSIYPLQRHNWVGLMENKG